MKPDVYAEPGKRDTRQWNQLGFLKSGVEMIEGKLRSEHVTILFKKERALFGASFLDMIFESKDYLALKAAMVKHLESHEQMTFHRYIEINFRRDHQGRHHGIGSWSGRNDGPMVGLSVRFIVYEVSEPFSSAIARGKAMVQVWRRLEREDDGTWRIDAADTRSVDCFDTEDLIAFTEQRYLTLAAIQTAIQNLAQKLGALLDDSVELRGQLLDRVAGLSVLQLAEGMQALGPEPDIEWWYRRDASWTVRSGKANGRGPTAAHRPGPNGGVALCDPKIAILDDDERGLDPAEDSFVKCRRCLAKMRKAE